MFTGLHMSIRMIFDESSLQSFDCCIQFDRAGCHRNDYPKFALGLRRWSHEHEIRWVPHWGNELRNIKGFETTYPKFQDFLDLRAKLDPSGMFLNGYLRQRFYG